MGTRIVGGETALLVERSKTIQHEDQVRAEIAPTVNAYLSDAWPPQRSLWKRVALDIVTNPGLTWVHYLSSWPEDNIVHTNTNSSKAKSNYTSAIANANIALKSLGFQVLRTFDENQNTIYNIVDNGEPDIAQVSYATILGTIERLDPVYIRVIRDLTTRRVYAGELYDDYENRIRRNKVRTENQTHGSIALLRIADEQLSQTPNKSEQDETKVSINNVTIQQARDILHSQGIALRRRIDETGKEYFTIDKPTRGESLTNFAPLHKQVEALLGINELKPGEYGKVVSVEDLAVDLGISNDRYAINDYTSSEDSFTWRQRVFYSINRARKYRGGIIVGKTRYQIRTHTTKGARVFYQLVPETQLTIDPKARINAIVAVLKSIPRGLPLDDIVSLVYSETELNNLGVGSRSRPVSRQVIDIINQYNRNNRGVNVIRKSDGIYYHSADLNELLDAESKISETIGADLDPIDIIGLSVPDKIIYIVRRYANIIWLFDANTRGRFDSFLIRNSASITGIGATDRPPIEEKALSDLCDALWLGIDIARHAEMQDIKGAVASHLDHEEFFKAIQLLKEIFESSQILPEDLTTISLNILGVDYQELKRSLGIEKLVTIIPKLIT